MGYKILIVDDEPSNIETIINNLIAGEFNVLIATSGQTGYEIAKQSNPNLIIMDWDMEQLNGIVTIKLLKSDETTSHIPVIMATGVMVSSENLKTALDAGAIDYIRKPIDGIELMARVHSAITLFEEMKKNIALQTELTRRKNEQMKKEIRSNKQALAQLSLRIIQQSDVNAKLFGELKKLCERTDKEGKKMINKLISEYKTDSMNINWDEFEVLFSNVHHEFYEKLTATFPDLTKNERKLCIFYKLNMNSNEICSMTLQTENALKKARSRLRKKLKISSSERITAFLQKTL